MVDNSSTDNGPADDGQEAQRLPWYRQPAGDHPFKLARKISLNGPDAPTFRSLSFFPWDSTSLEVLWRGNFNSPEDQARWNAIIAEYWDAVAITSDSSLYIFFTQQKRPPIILKLKQTEGGQRLLDTDKMCVSWAISSLEPFQPLVLFSRESVLYVYNVERRGIQGFLRGHGGTITSIAVHPTNVHLVCTTSRDLSTRVYSLSLQNHNAARNSKNDKVPNPVWPPNMKPSLAGAAHGLRIPLSELEGSGLGRCICVFVGGRSGGHNAAVLSAAFHPDFPLIATCGLDRAVKIWPVQPMSDLIIKREDKPLFSSTFIHRARVMSISWLEADLLATHSAPAVMRKDPDNPKGYKTYIEAGELTIWRWLGLDRFFPAAYEVSDPFLRGVPRDYLGSRTFKIISTHRFPDVPSQLLAPSLSLYHTSTHDPLMLVTYPGNTSFELVNAALMLPRPPPPFPQEVANFLLGDRPPTAARADSEASRAKSDELQTHATEAEPGTRPRAVKRRRMSKKVVQKAAHMIPTDLDFSHNDEDEYGGDGGEDEDEDEDENENEENYVSDDTIAKHSRLSGTTEALDHDDVDEDEPPSSSESEQEEDEEERVIEFVRRRPLAPPPPPVLGWHMHIQADEGGADEGRRVMASAMGLGGRVVVAVGTEGSVWIWKAR